MLCTASVHAGDAAVDFASRYTTAIQDVHDTPDPADDLKLAARMIDDAKAAPHNIAMAAQLCHHACDLAAPLPGGFDTAVRAMQTLSDLTAAAPADSSDAATAAAEHAAALDKLVELHRRDYITTHGPAKLPAGEALTQALLAQADDLHQHDADDKHAEAVLRQALSTALAIHSAHSGDIRARFQQYRQNRARRDQIDQLRQRIKADPKDTDAAEQLIRYYVLELDQPAEAHKLTFLVPDSPWAKNLPLAVLDPAKLSGAEALTLADWYNSLADQATDPNSRARMLRHAAVDYQYAGFDPKADNVQKQKVDFALSAVHRQLDQLGVNMPKIDPPAPLVAVAPKKPKPTPAPPAAPVEEAVASRENFILRPVGSPTYLCDLPEQDVQALNYHGTIMFSKNGRGIADIPSLKIANVRTPHGLLTHPGSHTPAHVRYDLGGHYRLFVGAVGVCDGEHDPSGRLFFSVKADGKVIWQSHVIRHRGSVQPFNLDVQGVHTLEIDVRVADGDGDAHAIWVEPALYERAAKADGTLLLADVPTPTPARDSTTPDQPAHTSTPAPRSHDDNTSTDNSGNGPTFFGIPTTH